MEETEVLREDEGDRGEMRGGADAERPACEKCV